MVLLVERLSKLYFKLENHHHLHRQSESEADVLSASLQAFRSHVSSCLNQLLLSSSSSQILSLSWLQQCFQLLPSINRAFAKLVVDINHPMSNWEAASVDEYLNYGFHLLELLNSVTSSLSHLTHSRLSFAHALSLLEKDSASLAIKHLKPIQPQSSSKDYKQPENKQESSQNNRVFSSNKERAVNEGLVEVKSISFWVCGVVLAALSGEAKPYSEIKQLIAKFNTCLLVGVDSCISDIIVEKGEGLIDVEEMNCAAASLASAIVSEEGSTDAAAKELERRLGVFESQIEGLEKEVNNLFSKVLAGRNELLQGMRQHKQ